MASVGWYVSGMIDEEVSVRWPVQDDKSRMVSVRHDVAQEILHARPKLTILGPTLCLPSLGPTPMLTFHGASLIHLPSYIYHPTFSIVHSSIRRRDEIRRQFGWQRMASLRSHRQMHRHLRKGGTSVRGWYEWYEGGTSARGW